MINSNGYLKKILSLSSILASTFLYLIISNISSPVRANGGIDTSVLANYSLDESGNLDVRLDIGLTNKQIIPAVVNYFTITLPFTNIDDIVIKRDGKEVKRTIHKQNVGSDVVIDFDSLVIPRNARAIFTAHFSKGKYVESSGSSVSLPSSFVGIKSVDVNILYPNTWSNPSWVSSEYRFNAGDLAKEISVKGVSTRAINVMFGESVSYDFEINKQLINSDSQPRVFDISLPTWSPTQAVTFEKFSLLPSSVSKDSDGNLNAKFLVAGSRTETINIKGSVVLGAPSQQAESVESLSASLENIEYWKLESDVEYKRFALFMQENGLRINAVKGSFGELKTKEEREEFISGAYGYVVQRLSSEDLSTSSFESPLRAGANTALSKRSSAVPEDYADLLISILRFYGVPSKMVVGYITESGGYRDSGFFHSWVEYWDVDLTSWRVLDPALEDFVGHSLADKDFRERISFVVRSSSSTLPKLSYFSNEELMFMPSPKTIEPVIKAEANLKVLDGDLAKNDTMALLRFKNYGNTPYTISDLKFLDGDKRIGYTTLLDYSQQVLLPNMELEIPLSFDSLDNSLDPQNVINVEYTAVIPNGQSEVFVDDLNLDLSNSWWWEWIVSSISVLLFLVGLGVIYLIFRKFKRLWT